MPAASPSTSLVQDKGASRNQGLSFGGGGTVIPQRLSVSFNGGVNRSFNQPNIYANTPNGLVSEPGQIRARSNGYNLYGDVTYALTKDQTLRVYYNQFNNDDVNNGVGQYDLLDRAGRYRVSIFLRVSNLTNHSNPFGYSGAMTSSLFGKPTNYAGVRSVNLGMNFGF